MHEVTQVLSAIQQGGTQEAEQLLPLVYNELRRLAAEKMVQEKPGQTLQATALVHEAYLRLVNAKNAAHWNSRGHFFAAAAEAMRRILVEAARRKQREKAGGAWHRVEPETTESATRSSPEELLGNEGSWGAVAFKKVTPTKAVVGSSDHIGSTNTPSNSSSAPAANDAAIVAFPLDWPRQR
jgi:RNA polymerase sigma factor (TIGR02999 family)